MSPALKQLFTGALKSAVAATSGLVISLPIVDPLTFNFSSLGGWKHILTIVGVTILTAEARYFGQWSNSSNAEPKVPLSQSLEPPKP